MSVTIKNRTQLTHNKLFTIKSTQTLFLNKTVNND